MPDYKHILLATLGGQPQVVTFTLDLLLDEGYPITEVYVIHPRASHPRLKRSLDLLSAEFLGNYYRAADRVIHFHSCVLQLDGRPIDDIIDDAHADGTLNTIHKLIGDLKLRECRIHLSLSGGRRLMALLAISVAVLNLDRHDHIWHIYTPEHIREQASEGRYMHVSPDAGVKLIEGPFLTLGPYITNTSPSFRAAQESQRSRLDDQEHARCVQVIKQATLREREVLQAFAEGLSPQEVAEKLHITIKTVDAHKTHLLDLCREVWNIEAGTRLGYHFLDKKFAPFYDTDQYTIQAEKTHQRNL